VREKNAGRHAQANAAYAIHWPPPRGCVVRHAQFGRGRRVTLRRWPAGSSPPCPPIEVRVAMPVRRRRSPQPRISCIMIVPSPATAFSSPTLHRFFHFPSTPVASRSYAHAADRSFTHCLPPRCSESVRRRNIAPWFS